VCCAPLCVYVQGVEDLPDYSKVSFPNMAPLPLAAVLPAVHTEDLALLATLLVLDPARRLSAQEAVQSPYFTSQSPRPAAAGSLAVPRGETQAVVDQKCKPVTSVDQFMREIVDRVVPESSI
jgi:hypothetical protein